MSVLEHLHRLRGLLCHDFRLIAGGSLILYIGDRSDERSLTDWRLHLEPAWRLDGPTSPLVGSFDACCEDRPADWVFEGLRSLIGRSVEEVAVGFPVLDLRIEMSGAYRLLSFSHEMSGGENWEFRHRSGLRLAMRALTECVEYSEEPDRIADQGRDSGSVPRDDSQEPKSFRTLRGFLTGEEVDEANYFYFSATLRIHGDAIPFEEINQRLGVQPTMVHRKGERRGPRSPDYRDDAWHFQASLPETEPLERHIEALWQIVSPQLDYLKALKQRFKVDVFCGYRSNCDYAGFEVSHKCLELFTALEVPFGVSVIVA